MSFALGWGPLLAFPLAGLVLMRRDSLASPGRLGALLAAFALALLAFVVAPRPFFALLPGWCAYVQFPWRLLGLASACAATALPLCLAALARGVGVRLLAAALGLLACAAVPAFERRPLSRPEWTRAHFTPEVVRAMGALGYTVQGEYLPRAFDAVPRPAPVALPVDLPAGGVLALPIHGFDFYRAEDSAGQRLPTLAQGPWLAVRMPPGSRLQRIRPVTTPAIWLGLGVSGFALSTWAVGFARARGRRRDGRTS
jgi:hypothetical protein